MNEEEMQRKMEFIVEQQAAHAIRMQEIDETMKMVSQATLANTGMIGRLLTSLERVAEAQVVTETKLAALTVRVDKLSDRVDAVVERVDAVVERFDAFIVVVERHIAEGHQGPQPGA